MEAPSLTIGRELCSRYAPDSHLCQVCCKKFLTHSLQNIYAQDIIEKLAYGSIKLSVLLFYRRIFCTPRFLKTNDIVIALTAMWTVSFFVVEIFICALHPAILWTYKNAQEKKAQCADSSMVLLWFAITDVLGDIVILSMPFRPIQILQKSKKEKLGIFAIFMLGALYVHSRFASLSRGKSVIELTVHNALDRRLRE